MTALVAGFERWPYHRAAQSGEKLATPMRPVIHRALKSAIAC
jgi:hypothetical protein